MTRIAPVVLGCASLLIPGGVWADQGKAAKGGDQPKDQKQQKGGGAEKKAKHQHKHANGKALLGDKLKKDGKHSVGKLANREVTAEVRGGKVRDMQAGDLPKKRVRTKTQMAAFEDGGVLRVAWTPAAAGLQLAQYEDYWYGYCFDTGYDFECYWYPASEVDYQDYTWEDYDPYY